MLGNASHPFINICQNLQSFEYPICIEGALLFPESINNLDNNVQDLNQFFVEKELTEFIIEHLIREKNKVFQDHPSLIDQKSKGQYTMCFDDKPDLYRKHAAIYTTSKTQDRKLTDKEISNLMKKAQVAKEYYSKKESFKGEIKKIEKRMRRVQRKLNDINGNNLRFMPACIRGVPACDERYQKLQNELKELKSKKQYYIDLANFELGQYDDEIKDSPIIYDHAKFLGPIPIIDIVPSKFAKDLMIIANRAQGKELSPILKETVQYSHKRAVKKKLKDIDDAIESICDRGKLSAFAYPNVAKVILDQKLKDAKNSNDEQAILTSFFNGYCVGVNERAKVQKIKKTINYIGTGIALIGIGIIASPFSSLAVLGTIASASGTTVALSGSYSRYRQDYKEFEISSGLRQTSLSDNKQLNEQLKNLKSSSLSFAGESVVLPAAVLGSIKKLAAITKVSYNTKSSLNLQTAANEIRLASGLAPDALDAIQKTAKKYNVQIRMRPTNPYSVNLRTKGHPAKPMEIKPQTIDDLDIYLGRTRDDLGKVGYFKPEQPHLSEIKDPNIRKLVATRYKKRLKQYHDEEKAIRKLVKQGKIKIDNGLVIDQKSGKAFTSDYDVFQIVDSKGKALNKKIYDLVLEELYKPPVSIQHPPHMNWGTKTYREKNKKNQIIQEHQETAIIQFNGSDDVLLRIVKN